MDVRGHRSKSSFVPPIIKIFAASHALRFSFQLHQHLQPAMAFVANTGMGAAISSYGAPKCYSCRAQATRPRFLLSALASEADADLPGIADIRLAGWRSGTRVEDDLGAAEYRSSSTLSSSDAPREPACGDVVEYPLSERTKEEANDGREKGVAVIVSINKHRNDSWKLPEDILDRAELQVLCPDLDADEEGVWMSDELETCAFASLGDMRVLKSEFNGALDKWKRWSIKDELSQGCGARDAEWDYDIL